VKHTQVQRSGFRDSAGMKRLRQIGAETQKRQLEEGMQATNSGANKRTLGRPYI